MKKVLDKMIVHRIKQIPVVESEEITGEITLHLLIRTFYELIRTPNEG